MCASCFVELREECVARLRLAAECLQDVERLDVAAALPDRIERRFAVEPRQDRLLDVARPAQALLRFVHFDRRSFADAVLADRRRDAGERTRPWIPWRLVDRSRHPHRQRRRGLGLEREIREHVLHERVLDEPLPECRPVACDGSPARAPAA